jgi:hypothetical protein
MMGLGVVAAKTSAAAELGSGPEPMQQARCPRMPSAAPPRVGCLESAHFRRRTARAGVRRAQ